MTQSMNMPLFAQVQRSHARQPAFGWGVSLLVHSIALFWLWHAAAPRHVDTGPTRQIEVRLVPVAANGAEHATAPAATVAPSHPASHPVASTPKPLLRQPRANLPLQTPVEPQALAPVEMPPANKPSSDGTATDAKPAFDLAAARASARVMAREDSRAMGAVSKSQDRLRATASDHLQEGFERARRADCLKAHSESMNLLANVVFLAKDMVANAVDDSGCKW